MSATTGIAPQIDEAISKCSRFVKIKTHNCTYPEDEEQEDLAYEVRLVVGFEEFQISTDWYETRAEAEEIKAKLSIALAQIAAAVNSPI